MNNISLSEMIPTEILQTIQDAFADYSGLAAMIADSNGVPVTQQSNFTDFCKLTRKSPCGSKNCQKCGREGAGRTLKTGKPAVYQCHTGMVDFAAPIMLEGEYIGHFAGGQTRVAELDEEFIRQKAREYDIDEEEYLAAARRNNITDWEWVERSAEFLSRLAGALSQIAYERMCILEDKRQIEKASDNQLGFMRNYAAGANTNMQEFTDFVGKLATGEIDSINQSDRDFLGDMTGELQNRITSINEAVVNTEISRGDMVLKEDIYDIRLMVDRKINEFTILGNKRGCKLECVVGEEVPHYFAGDSVKISEIIDKCVLSMMKNDKPDNIQIEIGVEKRGYGALLGIHISEDRTRLADSELDYITDHIRSREGADIVGDNERLDRFTEIGHLLKLMSGTFDMKRLEDGGLKVMIQIPQYIAEK